VKRREWHPSAILLLGALTACSAASPPDGEPRSEEDGRLVVALPPGRIDDFERVLVPAFERDTGIDIETVGLRSADQVARLRIEQGQPTMDVLWIDLAEAQLLGREGLIAAVTEAEVPNIARVRPEARRGTGIAPVTFSSALGFLYNTERLDGPPASWAALWDPAYRGEIVWFDFGSSLGPMTLALAARLAGGSEMDIDPGFVKLAELLPNIAHFGTSGPANNLLVAQGEAGVTFGLANQARDLAAGGAPVAWAVPEEGAIALPQGFQIVAATPRLAAAHAFLDYALGVEAQTRLANELLLAVSNADVELEAEVEPLVPLDRLLYLDVEVIGARRGEWTNRFNREILAR